MKRSCSPIPLRSFLAVQRFAFEMFRYALRAFFAEYGSLCPLWGTAAHIISIAVSRCSLHWFRRSMSVGYLMSEGATVASIINLPLFFFLARFFLDVLGFALPRTGFPLPGP